MKKIQIVTLTYNQLEYATKPFIESLYKYTNEEDFDLIIVDNASADGTKEYLKEIQNRYSNIKIILNDENLGYSKGNNQGLAIIDEQAPYIGLFNNDILFTPNWLENSIKEFEKDKKIGMASPRINRNKNVKINHIDYIEKYQKYLSKFKTTFTYDINSYFCCVMFTTEAFKRIGYLDENYTPAFWEDNDYIMRFLYAGYKMGYINTAYIYHHHQTTSKSITNEIFERNKKYFFDKHPLAVWIWEHKRTNLIKDVKKYILGCINQ